MNIVVIGSGGREHALAYKISQSKLLKKLYCIPGNYGTGNIAENINISLSDFNEISDFCKKVAADLVVIGPEKPLVDGLSDYLREKGFKVFGPDSEAAKIESSKKFSKHLMQKYNIPTARFREFSHLQVEDAINYARNSTFPLVIKADGLAAGKGVVICKNFNEAKNQLYDVLINNKFGDAGKNIIVEEFMEGNEASIFAVTDGEKYICLPAAQDHKRIGDNDTGENTGGMGAYAPTPFVTDEVLFKTKKMIIEPVLKALKTEGKKFIGCLYVGLMINNNNPKVVEFNCRFGDPETQAVMMLLDGDFLELLYSAATENLNLNTVSQKNGVSICVVAASGGYPGKYKTGFEIKGLNGDLLENTVIFFAGVKEENKKVLTAGGRVLAVTTYNRENNLKKAQEICYNELSKINFDGIYYRKDIANKAIEYLK